MKMSKIVFLNKSSNCFREFTASPCSMGRIVDNLAKIGFELLSIDGIRCNDYFEQYTLITKAA